MRRFGISVSDYQRFCASVVVDGSGSDMVILGLWLNGRFRHRSVRTPLNLSLHSWRYAIRQLGLRRALLARGFARP